MSPFFCSGLGLGSGMYIQRTRACDLLMHVGTQTVQISHRRPLCPQYSSTLDQLNKDLCCESLGHMLYDVQA